MSYFFSKIAKIGFWILVPTFFISGTKVDSQFSSKFHVDEGYAVQVTGTLNSTLGGDGTFETAVQTTANETSFSTLKLKLTNKQSSSPHQMEFLISQKKGTGLLSVGIYEVSGHEDGFLNYFDGVFGFANIKALGELPMFAKSGTVEIDYLDNSIAKGTISVTMSNTNGRSVQVKGNFTAER